MSIINLTITSINPLEQRRICLERKETWNSTPSYNMKRRLEKLIRERSSSKKVKEMEKMKEVSEEVSEEVLKVREVILKDLVNNKETISKTKSFQSTD